VAIGLAIGIYYSTADDMLIKRATDYAQLEEALNTPEKVAAITSSNEPLKDLTKEEIQQSYIERVNTMTSAKTVVAAGISAMMLNLVFLENRPLLELLPHLELQLNLVFLENQDFLDYQ
jgi:hypothetical protein